MKFSKDTKRWSKDEIKLKIKLQLWVKPQSDYQGFFDKNCLLIRLSHGSGLVLVFVFDLQTTQTKVLGVKDNNNNEQEETLSKLKGTTSLWLRS